MLNVYVKYMYIFLFPPTFWVKEKEIFLFTFTP